MSEEFEECASSLHCLGIDKCWPRNKRMYGPCRDLMSVHCYSTHAIYVTQSKQSYVMVHVRAAHATTMYVALKEAVAEGKKREEEIM